MSADALARRIEAVRRFNRFYTNKIGFLHEQLLDSPFSMAEARVIYELAHREETTAATMAGHLDMNRGYLSRTLRGLEQKGLVSRRASERDGRESILSLTEEGSDAFAKLNAGSRAEVGALLQTLPQDDQRALVGAMETIGRILGIGPEDRVPYILRPPEPGDFGWVVHRHGALYAAEYGYDETFEALVAEIVARFVQNFDGKRERCWIAEREGENVGSVFLVRDTESDAESVAKLRLLLVEPKARGLGIGKRLVDECIRFAKQKGYERIKLWTQDELATARHIYQSAGFHVVDKEPHHSFGHDLVAEVWEREL